MTDAELIAAREYARPTIKKILRNHPNDVDDVLSEATLNVLRSQQFRGDAMFKTYFFTCARNAALMLLRKRVRQFEEFVEEKHESTERSPEDEARLVQLRRVLLDEIRLLTPRRREAALEMLAGFPAKSSAKKAARFHARHELRARLNREAF